MLVLLWGCGPDEPGPKPKGDDNPEPEPIPWTQPTDVGPDLAQLDAEGGLVLLQETLLRLDTMSVFEAYDEAAGGADGYCPAAFGYEYGNGYVEQWYAQCTAESGNVFSGYVYDYNQPNYRSMYLSASIVTADGTTLSAVGSWAGSQAVYGDTAYHGHYVDGTFTWDGTGSRDTWFGEGISGNQLSIDWAAVGDQIQSLDVDGQLTNPGGGFDTFDFEEWSWTRDCDEPKGRVSMRTRDAVWIDVVFDGPRGGCDGCGEASWRGEALGEVCGDFSLLRQGVMP